MKKYIDDVCVDVNMLVFNIIVFGEICFKLNDWLGIVNLEGFNLLRNDDICCSGRVYYGLVVYIKGFINFFVGVNIFGVEFVYGYILNVDLFIYICFLYCFLKFVLLKLYKKFFVYLDIVYNLKNFYIFMGDFNLNFS